MASSPPRFLDEVRASARLAAPLAAGHLSHGLVGFVDTVIAGHHGTTTLAAVAVGTANFVDPSTPLRVVEGIEAYLLRHGMRSVRELTGALASG